MRIAKSWIVAFNCGNLFSKNNQTWEFIFEEKGLFEVSKNKNLSKITCYTVLISTLHPYPGCYSGPSLWQPVVTIGMAVDLSSEVGQVKHCL